MHPAGGGWGPYPGAQGAPPPPPPYGQAAFYPPGGYPPGPLPGYPPPPPPDSDQQQKDRRRQFLALICCLLVVAFLLLVLVLFAKGKREIDPENIDFGSSVLDQFCKHTFRPENAPPKDRSFITHGFPVARGSYPYLAFLITTTDGGNRSACTASILDDRHLLTAAHCVTEPHRKWAGSDSSDFIRSEVVKMVKLGTVVGLPQTGGLNDSYVRAYAEDIYIHPEYDSEGLGFVDIAVIRTKEPISFNNFIQPVCLASTSDKPIETCIGLGYGKNELDTNKMLVLNRAPNIDAFSQKQCTEGSMRSHSEKLFYDQIAAANPKASKSDLKQMASQMVDLYFRGKLCSLINPSNLQAICSGDSGGPLMCTPVGTMRSAEYQDPKSPLFNKTDPSLKQFGISMSMIKGRQCGAEGLMTIFTSVRYYRLWLEFVALPNLKNAQVAKQVEKEGVEKCLSKLEWTEITRKMSGKNREKFRSSQKLHVCRKLHAYLTCVKNSPKPSYCEHMDVTMIYNPQKVDMLPLFRKERCRQLNVCSGAWPVASRPALLLLAALHAWHGLSSLHRGH